MKVARLAAPRIALPDAANWNSPQARGLVAWWPFLPAAGNVWREHFTGLATAFAGSAARTIDAEAGHGVTVTNGSDAGTAMDRWQVLYPTFTAWVRTPATGAVHMIMTRDAASGTRIFQWRLETDNKLNAHAWNWLSQLQLVTSAVALSASTLYHVAFTWDGVTMRLFVNGVQDANTQAHTGPMLTGTRNLYLGRWGGTGASEYPFVGQIYDLRIYNVALTADVIWQMWHPATRWELYGRTRITRPYITVDEEPPVVVGGARVFGWAV